MEKIIEKAIERFEKKKEELYKLERKSGNFKYGQAIVELGYVTMYLRKTFEYIEKSQNFIDSAKEDKKSNEMIDFLDMKMIENEQIIDMTDRLYENLEGDEDFEILTEELIEHFGAAGIDVDKMDEGILGTLIGGVAGFFIGPKIGRIIARALGIEKGILFDMFNSKLVGAALGAAIVKSFKGKKKVTR